MSREFFSIMEESKKYPVFRNPDKYMKNRERGNPLGMIKIGGEYRALDRCLKDIPGIHTICDAPSGPGRMFPYWKKKNYTVYAVDISERMVSASQKIHETSGLPGKAAMGDIFKLNEMLEEKPDLVACIRFVYYFNSEDRAKLLQVLSETTSRYVLVQYKTTETIKGQMTLARRSSEVKKPQKTHLEQWAVSYNQIIKEMKQSGLNPLRIQPIGEFSDRVFVLAEKSDRGANQAFPSIKSPIILKDPSRLYIAAALILFFSLVYFMNSDRSFFKENEALLSLGARSVMKGDWIAPKIYNKISPGTSTLMYWWIAAASAPFSEVTERSARFANILVILGVLYSFYAFSKRSGRRGSGILAIILLGTGYIFWENASGVGMDMMLTLSLTVAWGALFSLLNNSFRIKYWGLLWGGLSIALFLIGPMALALTGVLFIIFASISWNPGEIWKRFIQIRPLSGFLVCLSPFLIWVSFVYSHYGWGAVKQIFANWHLITYANFIERPSNSIHYYFSVFPVKFLSWFLFLPLVVWRMKKQGSIKENPALCINRFAICSCIAIFFFFSFINPSGYHLLPMMPWIAFLIGDLLWKRLLALVPFDPDSDCQERVLLGRVLGLKSGRFYMVVTILFILGTVFYNDIMTHYKEDYSSPRLAALEIDENVGVDEKLVLVADTDPRILFYITRYHEFSDDSETAIQNLQKRLTSDQHMDLVVEGNDLFKFLKLKNYRIYIEDKIIFQNRVYYILTNQFRPGAIPLMSLILRRPV
jgi:hypothetical protein